MKLATIIAATAAMVSMSAMADAVDFGSNNFENQIVEDNRRIGLLDNTWTQEDDDMSYVTNYTEDVTAPADIASGNTQYLKLETEGNTLIKNLATDENTTTVFVDSYVKLVGNEDVPEVPADARVAVWLAKENIDGVAEAGDLMLYAGTGDFLDAANFKIASGIAEGSWHRITIESAVVYDEAYFRVWLDGEVCADANPTAYDGYSYPLTAADLELDDDQKGSCWFYGLNSEGGSIVSSVGFQGTGAIDNLAATDTNPFGGSSAVDIFFGGEDVDSESALAWAAANGLSKGDITANDSAKYYNQYLLNVAPDAAADLVISSITKVETGVELKIKAVVPADEGEDVVVDMMNFNGTVYVKSADSIAGLADAEEVAITPVFAEGDTESTVIITTGAFFKAFVK